jgi:hypothetical protein
MNLAVRTTAAVVLIALSCSCSEKKVRREPISLAETELKFRQIYDADEFAVQLRNGTDNYWAMAELSGPRSFYTPLSHYMRLFPHREEPEHKADEIRVSMGGLRLMMAEGVREVEYAFPAYSYTQEFHGERQICDYAGGEWDSGYLSAYGFCPRSVSMVLAMKGVRFEPAFEAGPPGYTPPTYVLPIEWSKDIRTTISDWANPAPAGVIESYTDGAGDVVMSERPLARLMAWQILLEGDAQERILRMTPADFPADPIFVGALTYRVFRYGSEKECDAYIKTVGVLLRSSDVQIDVEGFILGAAEAYTKCKQDRERINKLREEVRAVYASTNASDEFEIMRRKLYGELSDLTNRDPVPSTLKRFLSMLTPRENPNDEGLRCLLWKVVNPDGPQAKYSDRADRYSVSGQALIDK